MRYDVLREVLIGAFFGMACVLAEISIVHGIAYAGTVCSLMRIEKKLKDLGGN